ncbi:hypothetical protein E8E12_000253, partial [Didymella heteroderae]
MELPYLLFKKLVTAFGWYPYDGEGRVIAADQIKDGVNLPSSIPPVVSNLDEVPLSIETVQAVFIRAQQTLGGLP